MSKLSKKNRGTKAPNRTAKKKKRRRKKRPNETNVMYYDVLSRSNEEWLNYISAEDLLEMERAQNRTNNNVTTPLVTYKFELNPLKVQKDVWRRLNRTKLTTTRPIPHRLRRRTTKKWTTLRKQEDDDTSEDEEVHDTRRGDHLSYSTTSEDTEVDEKKRHAKKEKAKEKSKLTEYTESIETDKSDEREDKNAKEHSDRMHSRRKERERKEKVNVRKSTMKTTNKKKTEKKNSERSSEETEGVSSERSEKEDTSNMRTNEERSNNRYKTERKDRKKLKNPKKQKHEDTVEDKSNRDTRQVDACYSKTSDTTDEDEHSRRKKKQKKKRRMKRALSGSYQESSEDMDSQSSSQLKKERKKVNEIETRFTTGQRKVSKSKAKKSKKQRTLSVMEARQRRLDRKSTTSTTKRVPDPPYVSKFKDELKKLLTIPSSEIDDNDLTVKPDLTTKYSVDVNNIEALLGAINNTDNEKLFFDIVKDLEETGTVKRELHQEIEKSKKLPSGTLSKTTREEQTESVDKITKVIMTTEKTKRTKPRTTFQVYVDGYSVEKITTDTRKTKKILNQIVTTQKKSIHEILGITTKRPDSMEVLNTEEKKEFLHDAYFEYGKGGPVKMDIIVTSTPKPKIKTTRLQIERKITIDQNILEDIKKKKSNIDLKYLLGTHEDYYDQMKNIMDEKTIGKDTREHLMHERLVQKYGKEILERTETPKQTITEQQSVNTVISTSATFNEITTPTTEVSDYYFRANNPLFNIRMEPNEVITKKTNDDMENAIEEYNRQLLQEGEEDDDDEPKTQRKVTMESDAGDSSTMEHRSEYKKVLQHYLISNEKGRGSFSDKIKEMHSFNMTYNINKISDPSKMKDHSYTELSEKHTTSVSNNKKEELHTICNKVTTKIMKSSEMYEDEMKQKFRADMLQNPNFVEEKLSSESKSVQETAAERKLSRDLDNLIKVVKENSTKVEEKLSSTLRVVKQETMESTIVPPIDSKDIENMMKNKDEHFEKVLGEYMNQHTTKPRPERLRGKSTKVFSSTLPMSKDSVWDTTKNHCPAFLNQTEFDVQCQKFVKIVNKRGENQLQRVDFEMKTKNNNLGQMVSKNLLTANNFASVVKRKMKKPFDLSTDILYTVRPMRTLDTQALEKYKTMTGNVISKCGYFIDDKYPFLGAHPDGLIDNEGTVKFFNTSTYPNVNLKMLLLRDKSIQHNFIVGDKVTLNPEGDLMYEIQGELHISKRQFCDLFVYNGNDHFILKIERQKDFWKNKMRKALIDFYRQHMMPVIVKRLLHRRYKVCGGDSSYLLNSDEDLLSLIRGLRSDTTHQTIPTRGSTHPIAPNIIIDQEINQKQVDDSIGELEEEEWETLHKKTAPISIIGRTRSFAKEKNTQRDKSYETNKHREQKTRDKIKSKKSKVYEENSDRSTHYESQRKFKTKKQKEKQTSKSASESDEKKQFSSLESLYKSQEKLRHKIRRSKLKNKVSSLKADISKSNEQSDSKSIQIHRRKEKRRERSTSETKSFSSEEDQETDKGYQNREKRVMSKAENKIKKKKRKYISTDSSHEASPESEYKPKKKVKHGSENLGRETKGEKKKKRKKIVKREVLNEKLTEHKEQYNPIRGKRKKRDYVPLPEEDVSYDEHRRQKKKIEHKEGEDRVTIENLYSYKDTECIEDSYDPNESVFKSLPQHVAENQKKPDFLVDFYKRGLITKDEFLEIVKNKTAEGKPWRRIPSVESSKTFETENYSDLVKLVKNEPLSGIKESVTLDPEEYDKDDCCKKYMRNIGYGRPMDENLFNKSIVFTADDMKRLKQEKLELKLARAKAKRKSKKKKLDDSSKNTKKEVKKKRKIKGKRPNNTLSIGDLSLGDEDDVYDEVTKKKGRWKTTPGYDMYNETDRAHRRKWFRREYRKYWEDLSKLKKLYPSDESENPDLKESDRFYRRLKIETQKQKYTHEYTSIRECGHSYSEEYQDEREKRKERLRLKYENENTVEILKRLGRRLIRRKKFLELHNKTESFKPNVSSNLINIVKDEIVRRKEMLISKYTISTISTTKRLRRKRRSAAASGESQNYVGADDSSVHSNLNTSSNEFRQESEDTALRRAQQGEEEELPRDRTTIKIETDEDDRVFRREKRKKKMRLKQRPKYADKSSGSLEFILLQKDLKKNGEDFSYLSVSITDEDLATNQGNNSVECEREQPKGFYVTKPTRATMNDDEALMAILNEKSMEEKLLRNKETSGPEYKDKNEPININKNDETNQAYTVDDTTPYQTSSSNKQTKKRGRPRKQTNVTSVKPKTIKSKQMNKTEFSRVRRKRSIEQSKNKKSRILKRKPVSRDLYSSSEESTSSSTISRTVTKHRRTVNTIKDKHQQTSKQRFKARKVIHKRASKQSVSDIDLNSDQSEKSSQVRMNKQRKKHNMKSESSVSEESVSVERKSKRKHLRPKSSDTEESMERSSSKRIRKRYYTKDKQKGKREEKSDSSSSEESTRSKNNKQNRKIQNKIVRRKEKSSEHQSSPESEHETTSSEEDTSSESDERDKKRISASSKSLENIKKTKKNIQDIKKEFKAKQRKLRRKRKKLLKKKQKRQNATQVRKSQTTPTTLSTNQEKVNLKSKNPTTPYTPSTIQIRFTKNPRKYKKLPTRDIESIFDHNEDRYEDFIKQYNLKHSCTPFSKKAIKKLEIIKQKEFNHKYANETDSSEYKNGFDSYDKHNFDFDLNIPERKLKPWEESIEQKSTKEDIKDSDYGVEKIHAKKLKETGKRRDINYSKDDATNENKQKGRNPDQESLSKKHKNSEYVEQKRKRQKQKEEKTKLKSSETLSTEELESKRKDLKKRKEKERKMTPKSSEILSTEQLESKRKDLKKRKEKDKKMTSESSEMLSAEQLASKRKDLKKRKEKERKMTPKSSEMLSAEQLASKRKDLKKRKEKERKMTPKSSEILSAEQSASKRKDLKKRKEKEQEMKPKSSEMSSTQQSEKKLEQKTKTKSSEHLESRPNTKLSSEGEKETMYDASAERMYDTNELAAECAKEDKFSMGERDETASEIRLRHWRSDRHHTMRPNAVDLDNSIALKKPPEEIKGKEIGKDPNILKRGKRTPIEVTTEANVINMNPLLLTGGWSRKRKKKTTIFWRESTPWQSGETTTRRPLKRRLQKKLKQIQRGHDRYKLRTRNYTSVLEAKGLWELMYSPGQHYTTPPHDIDREVHLDFTSYRVTDRDIYNVIADKLIRDRAIPNKRKSQFRHSRQFFDMLMSTTPDLARYNMAEEMERYWADKQEVDLFLYRGQRDGRNRPNTDKYLSHLRVADGKRWRMLAWGRSTTQATTTRKWELTKKRGGKKLGIRE